VIANKNKYASVPTVFLEMTNDTVTRAINYVTKS